MKEGLVTVGMVKQDHSERKVSILREERGAFRNRRMREGEHTMCVRRLALRSQSL